MTSTIAKCLVVLLGAVVCLCRAQGVAGDVQALEVELRAAAAEFELFKQARLEAVQRLRAEDAVIQGDLRERIHHLEEASARRRLDSDANAQSIADLTSATNHTWLLLCGALVMFMQAGFAMLEAGCCRSKNVQNILMKNLVDVCVGTMSWWAFGWCLAYGIADGENHAFANSNQAFGMGMTEVTESGIFTPSTDMLNWFFQWAFCSAAATIVSGGVAERVKFPGYLIFTIVMTSWIYPVVVHWTWGYGWLSGGDDYQINPTGFMDFAGSGVVHMCGGVGALIGAIVVGPRRGRFDEDADFDFNPHSLPMIILGTFILWFGWYGFNCGSTLGMASMSQGTMAAQVAMNTTLAAAAGGLVVLILRFAIYRKYDIGGMCNGILAGLVSVTAPCGNVECGSAFLIGIIGGFVYQGASSLLQKARVDDPIDAFAVHGACGAWGTLAAVLFDWGTGMDYFNGWSGWSCVGAPDCTSGAWGEAFAANIVEIIAIAGWTAFWALLIFVPLRIFGLLRADDESQDQGMDTLKHSPSKAYSLD